MPDYDIHVTLLAPFGQKRVDARRKQLYTFYTFNPRPTWIMGFYVGRFRKT